MAGGIGVIHPHAHHMSSSTIGKNRQRLNMKINETDNSVYFYNTDVPDFGRYLLSRQFADVQLVCGEHKIDAHKSRLSSVSPFLACLFAQDTSDVSVVVIPDVSYQALRILIHFIYNGFIRATESEVVEVMEAARVLGINRDIDVEDAAIRKSLTTSTGRKRKRNAEYNSKHIKKTCPAQTVLIFDAQEDSRRASQPLRDPLDIPDVYSDLMRTLRDTTNREPVKTPRPRDSSITEMYSGAPVLQHGKNSGKTARKSSAAFKTSQNQSEMPILKGLLNAPKETANVPAQPVSPVHHSISEKDPVEPPVRSLNKDVELTSPTCQDEFQNFVKNTTPPKIVKEPQEKLRVVSMVSLTSAMQPSESSAVSLEESVPLPMSDKELDFVPAEKNIPEGDSSHVEDLSPAVAEEIKEATSNMEQPTGPLEPNSQLVEDPQLERPTTTLEPEKQPNEDQSSTSLFVPSPQPEVRTDLAKTVQQAVAGLLMWKSSKQKQPKPEEQPEAQSSSGPPKSQLLQSITFLSPKPQKKVPISEAEKSVIEKDLSEWMKNSQVDPLAATSHSDSQANEPS